MILDEENKKGWGLEKSGTFSRVYVRMPCIYACGNTFFRRKFDGNVKNSGTGDSVQVGYVMSEKVAAPLSPS